MATRNQLGRTAFRRNTSLLHQAGHSTDFDCLMTMPEIPRWKLSEFFTRFAPRYVLGTTYTASPVFFETSILPKIDRRALQGAVMADRTAS